MAMTSTSRSMRAWSVSIFRKTSPTRNVRALRMGDDDLDLLHGADHGSGAGRDGTPGPLRCHVARDGSAAVLVDQVPAEPVETKALPECRAFVAFRVWSEWVMCDGCSSCEARN